MLNIVEICLITFGVVLVWRGFWGLMDIYIFPDNNQYYGTSTVPKNFESTAVGNAVY